MPLFAVKAGCDLTHCAWGLQNAFLTKDEPLGTYMPYDLGQDLGIWINNSDGFTPALGKVSTT